MPRVAIDIQEKYLRRDGTTNLKFRINHKTAVRFISSPYYVLPKDFPDKITKDVLSELHVLQGDLIKKIQGINDVKNIDIRNLMSILRDKRHSYSIIKLLEEKIISLTKEQNINYASRFACTKRAVEASGLPINMQYIDYSWLLKFEAYLKDTRGLNSNSIRIYMCDIRTIHNIAQKIPGSRLFNPFKEYKFPKSTTLNKDLTLNEIKTIVSVRLDDYPTQWARDMFMLSFYLIGINMIDLFHAKTIEDDRLHYVRSKGKKNYSIKVFQPALDIIVKYKGKKYLLDTLERYSDYRKATFRVNVKLKDVAELCNINKPISTYYARHSWATIASDYTSEDIISLALGHAVLFPKNAVTGIYIKKILSKVDAVNEIIISKIIIDEDYYISNLNL